MKTNSCTMALCAIGVLAGMPLGAIAQHAQRGTVEGAVIPARILVVPRAGMPQARLDHALATAGAWGARRISSHGLHVVEVAEGTEADTVARLSHNKHFKLVALDRVVAHALTTNDPYLGSAWQLAKIGAIAAWDVTRGAGVTIAILDSGVDPTHPDLLSNLVAGWNFYSGNSDTRDVYGHGTKVAGVAAAAANNGIGVAGIASGSKIMPIRVTDAAGQGSVSAIAQGIAWAADNGARVANISFLVAGNSTILNAAQYMQAKGGLVFVSAGNSGALDSTAPSSAVIAVGSTESNDTLSSFSSYGSYVDLAAPGGSVYTTINGGSYGPASGTSFSSPIAAGAAALLFAARPALSSTNVEQLLKSTAIDLGAAGTDSYFGAGRIDVAAAMNAATGAVVPVDATPPSATITSPAAGTSVSGVLVIDVVANDNLGVTRMDLLVNGSVVASDNAAPFGFAWDTSTGANGIAEIGVRAHDAAGNAAISSVVTVNIANATTLDNIPPMVAIKSPTAGSMVIGNAQVFTAADDNMGASGVTQVLRLDGKIVASGAGGASLNYNWNTRKSKAGSHVLTLTGADRAGNITTTSTTVNVAR